MAEESTTPDLVELTRRVYDAVNRRDLDSLVGCYAPHAVFEVVALGTSFEGVGAIRGFMEDWFDAYEELEFDVEEILGLGNGVVVGVLVQRGRPAGSTGHVRYRIAQVTTWVEGVIVRVTGYQDVDEARAAAERLAKERADG